MHDHQTGHLDTEAHGQLMYIKCAQCGAWMDVKPGNLNEVSHGFCPACTERQVRAFDAQST